MSLDDIDPSWFESAKVESEARPLLKWVGGKAQLKGQILELLPKKFNTYHEPFFGGGAIFWALAHEGRFEHAVINDWNPELINLYTVVKHCALELMLALEVHQTAYNASSDQKAYYLQVRAETPGDPVQKAARTIFLNKTNFNGLYRQNKKGQFNVPWGKKAKVNLFDRDNVLACAKALALVDNFYTGDFVPAVAEAKAGDVVYMDPPYIPHSVTSNFTGYTSDGFTMEDQKRVAQTARELVERGVQVLVSNNDVPIISELYEGFEIHKIEARRSVNSKGDKRGPVGEVLIRSRKSHD